MAYLYEFSFGSPESGSDTMLMHEDPMTKEDLLNLYNACIEQAYYEYLVAEFREEDGETVIDILVRDGESKDYWKLDHLFNAHQENWKSNALNLMCERYGFSFVKCHESVCLSDWTKSLDDSGDRSWGDGEEQDAKVIQACRQGLQRFYAENPSIIDQIVDFPKEYLELEQDE